MMCGKRVVVLGVGLLLAATGTVWGSGFANPGLGARARGMGGSFIGVANDWSAVYHNPAGLTRLESTELNFSLSVYSPRAEYTPNVGGIDGNGFFNGSARVPDDRGYPIPSMAGIVRLPQAERLAFGMAIYWPYDANNSWNLFQAPFGYVDTTGFAGETHRSDLDVLDVHPTVAYALVPGKLSVGGGVSLTSGDVIYRTIHFVENTLGHPYNNVPFHNFIGQFELEGNGFGIGANVGALWQASEKLTIGASYQTPITITVDGRSNLMMHWPKSIFGDSGAVHQQLFEGDVTRSSAGYEFDLDLPGRFGVGLGYAASDRTTWSLDLVVTMWSAVDEWKIAIDGTGLDVDPRVSNEIDPVTGLTVPFGWSDAVLIAGGVEHAFKPNWTFRGGFYVDGKAAADVRNPIFPDAGSKVGLNLGVSYFFQHLEFALQQDMGFGSSETIEPSAGSSAFAGEHGFSRYETLASVSFRF